MFPYFILFQKKGNCLLSYFKQEVNKVVAFNPKYSKEIKRLFYKISAGAKVIQLYSTKVQNKSVLREALKVLKSKQQIAKRRESIILGKY